MYAFANLFLTYLYVPLLSVRMWCSPTLLLSRKSVSLPLKWFTIGQCWRYERMTRGRRREHYQWNMDMFGVPKVRVPPFSFIDSGCCCARMLLNWFSIAISFFESGWGWASSCYCSLISTSWSYIFRCGDQGVQSEGNLSHSLKYPSLVSHFP